MHPRRCSPHVCLPLDRKCRPILLPGIPPRQFDTPQGVREDSKSAKLIDLLRSKQGTTIAEMTKATGWQAHSVRGFLAGAARKRHGLAVTSARADGEERSYRCG